MSKLSVEKITELRVRVAEGLPPWRTTAVECLLHAILFELRFANALVLGEAEALRDAPMVASVLPAVHTTIGSPLRQPVGETVLETSVTIEKG